MATPADQRLLDLLQKWLTSLDLHIRYSGLDADSYWKVQPWPEHQRPSRWIIDLAIQKALALRTQVEERIELGDTKFSDSLELMTFLANLIGSEHIERFIPLAEPENERDLRTRESEETPQAGADATPVTPAAATPVAAAAAAVAPAAPAAETGTREMPKFVAGKRHAPKPSVPATAAAAAPPAASGGKRVPAPASAGSAPRSAARAAPRGAPDNPTGTREMPQLITAKRRAPAPVGTAQVARTERRPADPKPAPRTSPRQPARIESPDDAAREQVIADAARLVQWGRKWFELAELIARMADRPPLPEVRRILKENKTAIEKKAGG
jgi:hypothetical protein